MRSRLSSAAFVLMLAAIPVAGILQYRWINRVAEAEQERETGRLVKELDRLASEFDAEITRAHMAFGPGPVPAGSEWLSERMADWRSRAPVPEIIAEAWFISAGDEAPVVIDREGNVTPSHDVPAEFPLQGPPRRGPGPPVITVDGRTALVLPPSPRGGRGGPFDGPPPPRPPGDEPGPPRHFGARVIVLNDEFLKDTFIPRLARRHLGEHSYELKTEQKGGGDISVPLLSFRPDCLMEGAAGPGPGPRRFRPYMDVLRLPARDCGAAEFGQWTLTVRPREGSLAAAAASFRARSLAASAAVLALMAGAVIALWISVHRARALAHRQVEFAMAVSHELKTPLTVMRLAGDNLASGVALAPEQTRRYGETIRSEAERLGNMVEQVLTFARAQRPDWTVHRGPVEPAAVVDGAVAASEGVLRDAGVEVVREVEPDLPTVQADSNLMISAVTNLLENAARHAGSGKWVRVRAYSGDNSLIFEVADRGPGIGPRDLRHIFKPFYRGRGAAQVKGTGLGLHLVQRIATAHGGTVSVESSTGAGAAVRIRLPLKETSA